MKILLLQQARSGVQLPSWLPSIRNQNPLVHFQANLGVTPVYYGMIWSVSGIIYYLIHEDLHAFSVLAS